MKVICSAGQGELDQHQCLACALMGANQCGYSYQLLKAMFGNDETEQRRSEIHVTDLTSCLRKAYYAKTVEVAEPVHTMLARTLGTLTRGGLEKSDDNVLCEMPVEYGGVVGRIDTYYPQKGVIADIKTTRWLYADRLPYGTHALQVNIDGLMLEKTGMPVNGLQIQYIDMSGPTKCRKCKSAISYVNGEYRCNNCSAVIPNAHLGAVVVDIPKMPDVEVVFNHKVGQLKACLDSQKMPAKEPGYICDYCQFSDLCFAEGE